MPTGLNSDSNFERTFADLASAVLQDRSPALLDYMVGFQVLDVNEDQTKSVGVFGCQVGNEMVYLPVFFMNGELKGSELMYLKSQDLFCPSSEAWVSYLLNRKPYKLGETSERTRKDISSGAVDLLPFRASPENFGKAAEFKTTPAKSYLVVKSASHRAVPCWSEQRVQKWVEPFVAAVKRSVHSDHYKQAAARLDLVSVLSELPPNITKGVLNSMSKQASFGEAVLRYYPLDKLKTINPFREKRAEAPQLPDVRIVSYKEMGKFDNLGLSDSDKSKLLKGEVVIRDHRNETSKVYKLSAPMRAQSVVESGIYEVPLVSGEVVKALVLVGALEIPPRKQDCGLHANPGPTYRSPGMSNRLTSVHLINLSGKGYWFGNNDQLYGMPIDSGRFGYASTFADMKDVKKMEVGNIYCLVSVNGSSVRPFRVFRKEELPDGNTSFYVTSILTPYNIKDIDRLNTYDSAQIIVRDHQVGGIEVVGDSFYVGSNCRAQEVSIEKPKYDEHGSRIYGQEAENYGMDKPADMKNVEQMMWRNGSAVPLKFYTNGTEFKLSISDVDGATKSAEFHSWREALNACVYGLGIHGETAHKMIKDAQAHSNRAVKYLVKIAQGYSTKNLEKRAVDPYMYPGTYSSPAFDDSMGQSYDSAVNVPTQTPVSMNSPVLDMKANMADFQLYNPNPQLDQNPYQVLQGAAQTGQKEVFDTALIGSLVNSSDNNKLIDKYVGDLILGMDRIGRIYFLFLQHNEDFENRYGQEDMVELEDSLRNTFTSVGDLVLFLKQKTVESSKSKDKTKVEL